MPSLILLKSPPEGASPNKNIPLTGDQMVIGRDENGCQIVIPHHAVSRKHAQITRTGNQFFIEDLKSRNKTYLNNRPVETRTPLNDQDRIKICDFLATYPELFTPRAARLPVGGFQPTCYASVAGLGPGGTPPPYPHLGEARRRVVQRVSQPDGARRAGGGHAGARTRGNTSPGAANSRTGGRRSAASGR